MPRIQDYRIVISACPATNERRAAAFVARYIRLMTGRQIATVTRHWAPRYTKYSWAIPSP